MAESSAFQPRVGNTPLRDTLRGRITGRLDWAGLIAGSALPDPVRELVHAVVKRSRLWRLERFDVARELIAHFADSLDAGNTVDDLVRDFGDPATAAKLIRRAKKRQRPLPWHVVRWTGWGFLGLIGIYVLLTLVLLMGEPNPTVDYLAQVNAGAAAVPPDDRAWPLYREALVALGYETASLPDRLHAVLRAADDAIYQTPQVAETVMPAEVADFLAGHESALALIRQAARQPEMGLSVGFLNPERPHALPSATGTPSAQGESLMEVLLPALGTMRAVARLLDADTRIAAASGDAERVLANLEALPGLAEHAAETPIIINGLVGQSINVLSLRLLGWVVHEHPELLTEIQLQRLAHLYARPSSLTVRHLEGERLSFYDFVQRAYTDGGIGGGRLTPEGLVLLSQVQGTNDFRNVRRAVGPIGEALAAPMLQITTARRDEVESMYDRLMDDAVLAFQQPLGGTAHLARDAELQQIVQDDRLYYMAVTEMLPEVSPLWASQQKYLGQRDGVLLGIALELYRRDRDDWPSALADLVPRYMPDLPPDRVAGRPLRYRVTADGPMIYSLGADGDDDGGVPPLDASGDPAPLIAAVWPSDDKQYAVPNGDWVLWPVRP